MIGIKGAGEMGTGVAWRLHMACFRNIFMMETPSPLAVRREVSFCEAVHDGRKTVEGVEAVRVHCAEDIRDAWDKGKIAVLVDPEWKAIGKMRPHTVVDAILAKKNLGTTVADARRVIGLGPGFVAGEEVHMVIETNRGHDLGRVITSGRAASNTGIPGDICGHTEKRVLRSPKAGMFRAERAIGDPVICGQIVGYVEGKDIRAEIDGVLRGLIRPGFPTHQGMKIGDVDPRGNGDYCYTISDKARAIGGSVLEAILREG